MGDATTITITRWKIHRRGGRFAWYWTYEAVGPDTIEIPASGGTTREIPRKFTNDSIVELRRVLKRAYGRDVRLVEGWKR